MILVVAGEPDATLLTAALLRVDYQPNVVSNADEARAELETAEWECIVITEETLPGDPAEYFNTLRRETTAPTLIVGWGEGDIETQLLLDGADIYMVRPIDDDLLRARLRALARRRRPAPGGVRPPPGGVRNATSPPTRTTGGESLR